MTTLTQEKIKTSFSAILFGFISYGAFFICFNYHIAFLGDLFVPISVDNAHKGPLISSILIDVGLVALFAIQHTVMADTSFKKWSTKFIPKVYERPLYVAASSAVLAYLMWQWRSIDIIVWQLTSEWAIWLVWSLFVLGWGILFLSTFLIDHWHLFGLKQALGREHTGVIKFVTPSLYKIVRHPMMTGIFIAIWAAPTMTLGHAVFSLCMTLYILVGIRFEEKKLVDELGYEYKEYQKTVPPLIPSFKKRMGQ